MANRLRLRSQALVGTARARVRITPALDLRARSLLAPRALLRLAVKVQSQGAPLLSPQVKIKVLVPSLRAHGQPLLAPQARLARLVRGQGQDQAPMGAALGLGWPHYASGRGEAILGAAQGQGAPILSGGGLESAIAPRPARGQGANLGDAWYDWFDRTLSSSSGP